MYIVEKDIRFRFDLVHLREEVYRLVDKFPDNTQIGLTHRVGASDTYNDGTGSIAGQDGRERVFTEFNQDLLGSYLHTVYRTIPNIGRFRIMVLDGPAMLTIHNDYTERYHIAIDTNPDAYLLFPDSSTLCHIPADGCVYKANTVLRHTAINGSRKKRIHLVLDDLGTHI